MPAGFAAVAFQDSFVPDRAKPLLGRNLFRLCAFHLTFCPGGEIAMESAGVGWIAAIIIGGIAGWLAEKFMNSNMGVFMNIVLGIVGAIVANWILSILHIQPLSGWLGYLITGFVGACILIALGRLVRR